MSVMAFASVGNNRDMPGRVRTEWPWCDRTFWMYGDLSGASESGVEFVLRPPSANRKPSLGRVKLDPLSATLHRLSDGVRCQPGIRLFLLLRQQEDHPCELAHLGQLGCVECRHAKEPLEEWESGCELRSAHLERREVLRVVDQRLEHVLSDDDAIRWGR